VLPQPHASPPAALRASGYDRPLVDPYGQKPGPASPLDVEVALLRRIAAGDQQALEQLYHLYAGRILSFLRQLCRNGEVAEDLLQDVFMAVWRKAATFDAGRGDVAGWLFTICRHKWIDSRRRHHPTVELDAMDYDPPAPHSTRELRLALEQAMSTLGASEREALSMAYFGGLTYEETAARLALPLGTLKSRIRAGLKKIAAHIGDPA
jgi:RNA polymerase sigma-70 factor (ECF subfamily)